MSRSRNKIRIAITPSSIGVQNNGAWHDISVVTTGHQPDLSGLAQHLTHHAVRGHAEITLSSRLAPVWLLDPPPVRLKPSEMQGWVSDQLASQFGDLTESWRLNWDAPAPGEPVLVAAVDAAWLESLTETLRLAGIAVRNVQPWLSVAFRACGDEMSSRAAWLALIEPGQISLAGFDNGALSVLRANPFHEQADVVQALSEMLHRESLLNPELKASDIWIRSVQVIADWHRLKNIQVHTAPSTKNPLAAMGDI